MRRRARRTQVTAICGSTRSATATAEKWGIPEVYGDYDYRSLVRSPQVDVVHITSPNKVHVAQSLAALAAGLPETVAGAFSAIVYAVPAQLLAYHVACVKGTDVDQPRNLAKSVTVE